MLMKRLEALSPLATPIVPVMVTLAHSKLMFDKEMSKDLAKYSLTNGAKMSNLP